MKFPSDLRKSASAAIPERPLVQIRLIMLAIASFYTVLATAQSLQAQGTSAPRAAGILLGSVVLNVAWVKAYRQGQFTTRLDAAATVAVALLTFGAMPPERAVPVLYMTVVLRMLYGDGWKRLSSTTIATIAGYAAGRTVAGQFDAVITTNLSDYLAIGVLAPMMSLMQRSLSAAQGSIDREQLLARTGTALLRADSPEEVFRLARAAVLEGCLAFPGTWVSVTPDTDLAPAARLFRPGPLLLEVPLKFGAQTGRITLTNAGQRIPRQIGGLVVAMAAQAELALDRIMTSARWSSLVQNSSDLIIVVDAMGLMQYVSPAAGPVLGEPDTALVGQPLTSILEPSETAMVAEALAGRGAHGRLQHRMRHSDGSWVQVETCHADLSASASVAGIILNCRDISETKVLEEQLRHRAFHDPLTSLPNRALFEDRLDQTLRRRGDAARCAVMFLDLDDFKNVNDSLGHAAGDQLLRVTGERIQACLRDSDTAARLGGDEFAVLLDNCLEAADACVVAGRIAQALDAPIVIEGQRIYTRASVGVTVDTESPPTVEEMLRRADVAMYIAKSRGKGRVQLFEDGMGVESEARPPRRRPSLVPASAG